MPRRILIRCGLVALLACSTSCGTLSKSLWREAFAAEQLAGVGDLEVRRVVWNADRRALAFEYDISPGLAAQDDLVNQLPPRGWMQLIDRGEHPGFGQLVAAGVIREIRLEIVKHRRGPKRRWRATVRTLGRNAKRSHWNVAVSAEQPHGRLEPLPHGLIPSEVPFMMFERDSRAWSVTRAFLLTPVYGLADLFTNEEMWSNLGGALVEGICEELVGDALDSGAKPAKRSSRKQPRRTSCGTPARRRARRVKPDKPRLRPRR